MSTSTILHPQPLPDTSLSLLVAIHDILDRRSFVLTSLGDGILPTSPTLPNGLPEDWASQCTTSTGGGVTLVYAHSSSKQKLLLSAMLSGTYLILHTHNPDTPDEDTGRSTSLRIKDHVDPNGVLLDSNLAFLVERDLLGSIRPPLTHQEHHHRHPPPPQPEFIPGGGFLPPGRSSQPFEIGRGDRLPFPGPSGGNGMLIGPSHPGFSTGQAGGPLAGGGVPLPPGSVPPGARFDPLGPGPEFAPPGHRPQPGLGLGLGRGGDPDHLPPPGMYDNMYS